MTVALAAGHVAGAGVVAFVAAGFLLLVVWCTTHRHVDQTLAGLALYLGLFDGYVKLRTGSANITLARDVLVMAIAAGALLRAGRQLIMPPLSGLVVGFAAIVLVELLNPAERGIAAGLAGVRQHLEFVPLFFLGYAFVRDERQLRKFLFILVLCAAAGGVVSYIQSTLTPEQLAGWGIGYRQRILGTGDFAGAGRVAFDAAGNTFVRPFGLGSDSGAGALAAALALPALIALLMSGRGRVRLALVPLSVGIALAVATSGSRAALITVFVSAVAFGLLASASKNTLRVVAGLAVSAILVYAVFQQFGASNKSTNRAESIAPTRALATFSRERGTSVGKLDDYMTRYPLGVGVGSVGPASSVGARSQANETLNSETQWNFLVLETGVAGLALFVILNLRLVALAATRIRKITEQSTRLYVAALAAPLLGLLAAGFAGPTTATVPAAPYFWLVAGLLSYWLVTRHRERADDRSAQSVMLRSL